MTEGPGAPVSTARAGSSWRPRPFGHGPGRLGGRRGRRYLRRREGGFPGFLGRGPRAGRGDVRAAILALLAEEPMHGYQIMRELGERSGGVWRPSPGLIYPTLQQLEDEELVRPETGDGGRRVFTLTDAGREAQSAAAGGPAPWEEVGAEGDASALELRDLVGQVMGAARQVVHAGEAAQIAQAKDVLRDARRKLYRILAKDAPEPAARPASPRTSPAWGRISRHPRRNNGSGSKCGPAPSGGPCPRALRRRNSAVAALHPAHARLKPSDGADSLRQVASRRVSPTLGTARTGWGQTPTPGQTPFLARSLRPWRLGLHLRSPGCSTPPRPLGCWPSLAVRWRRTR